MTYENKQMSDFIAQAEAIRDMLVTRHVSTYSKFIANQLLDAYNLGFDEAVILIAKQSNKLGE